MKNTMRKLYDSRAFWVIVSLIGGISAYFKLKKLPEEEELPEIQEAPEQETQEAQEI